MTQRITRDGVADGEFRHSHELIVALVGRGDLGSIRVAQIVALRLRDRDRGAAGTGRQSRKLIVSEAGDPVALIGPQRRIEALHRDRM